MERRLVTSPLYNSSAATEGLGYNFSTATMTDVIIRGCMHRYCSFLAIW